MKTSTEIDSLSRKIGEEKAIEFVAKAGFDAFDINLSAMTRREGMEIFPADHPFAKPDYLKFVRRLRRVAEDNGIYSNQSHAPFFAYMDKVKDYLKRAIECTAEAGAKICVVHPDAFASVEVVAESYQKLLPFAKEHGVKIATENIWNMVGGVITSMCGSDEKSLKMLVDLVDDEDFVVCLDVGHAEMKDLRTSAVKIINALGDKIEALHIHDNDLKNDLHLKPGDGKIDYKPIVKALKENGYRGEFTLEAERFLLNVSEENLFEGTKKLYSSVKALADDFEAL